MNRSVRPEDIVLDRHNGAGKGSITESIYLGNITEYELLTGNRILKVQAKGKEYFEPGEEVFFSFQRATMIGGASSAEG